MNTVTLIVRVINLTARVEPDGCMHGQTDGWTEIWTTILGHATVKL